MKTLTTRIVLGLSGAIALFIGGSVLTGPIGFAAANGIALPYSCKAGVCSTCRTRLVKGKADMNVNYALEPWELEKGFILTCQACPRTDAIELDFDQA